MDTPLYEFFTWINSSKEDPDLARQSLSYAVGFHSAEHGKAIVKLLETANSYYREEKEKESNVRDL